MKHLKVLKTNATIKEMHQNKQTLAPDKQTLAPDKQTKKANKHVDPTQCS